jgi:geranylgeranyl transferase type-2 subunit beta
MSLAAGPGRGRIADGQLPDELKLVVDKHVAYIQSLDTVVLPIVNFARDLG